MLLPGFLAATFQRFHGLRRFTPNAAVGISPWLGR